MISDCTSDMLKQQTCNVHIFSDKINAIQIFELSKLYLTESKPKNCSELLFETKSFYKE